MKKVLACLSTLTAGVVLAFMMSFAAAGTASAGTATGGCSRVTTTSGNGGWRAVAAKPAHLPGNGGGCTYSNIYGHVEIKGPGGIHVNGPTNNNPAAVAHSDHLHGRLCATMWQDNRNGVYVNRGTACLNV